jgi:Mce-associated membrane protein
VPRPTRPAPASRRRPVAGTRGRRPSTPADPPAARTGKAADAGRPVRDPPARPRPAPGPKASPARGVAPPAPPRTAGRAGDSRAVALLTGLAVAAVVLLGAVIVLGWSTWQASRTAAAGEHALAASRPHAQEILSYDYRNIDADIARAKKDITGPFQKEYSDTTSKVVKPTAVQYHAVVTATVKAASVVSASPTKVVVLVFVNQTTTSTQVQGAKVDQSRVRLTLVRTGGKWLVSQVDAL